MKKWKLTGEKVVNLCLLLVSAFYLAYSLTHYKVGSVRMPKEGFLPMIIGVGGVCVSAFLTVQSWLDRGIAEVLTTPYILADNVRSYGSLYFILSLCSHAQHHQCAKQQSCFSQCYHNLLPFCVCVIIFCGLSTDFLICLS